MTTPHTEPTTGTDDARAVRTAIVTGAAGGVGSRTVQRLAEHGWHVIAITRTNEDAQRMATELAVEMTVLQVDALGDENVRANPPNRCYYCKRRIFSAIRAQVVRDGFEVLLDGTNASDDVADRPGMVALQELSVLSPLRICGLTKPEIRRLSREAGLFTWDKPAYACLATRIPYGQSLEPRLLERTERAESFLFSLGFSDFRVRTLGENAKIQLPASQLPLLMEHREEIVGELKKAYNTVLLDLETRDE